MTTTTSLSPPRSAAAGRIPGLIRNYAIIWVTLALVVLLAATTHNFLTLENIRNIGDQQSPTLIVAAATTLTIIAGGFDVSLSAIYVLTPIVAVQVANHTGSLVLGILAAIIAGGAAGAVNGLIVTGLRVNSFIATLASSFVFFGLAYIVSGQAIVTPTAATFGDFAETRILGFSSATWIAIIVVIICWILLGATRFGRYVYATGGNPEAGRLAGVRTSWVLAATFVLGGLACGLAGAVNASQNLSVQASDDFTFVFGVVAAVVVGGTSIAGGIGAVWRTVVGVLFIAVLVNGFTINGINPIYQRIIEGLVILVAVCLDSWSRTRRR
jgi:ribose transport system permease protein